MLTLAIFITGTIIGSFLNVCIHRVPSRRVSCLPALPLPRLRRANP